MRHFKAIAHMNVLPLCALLHASTFQSSFRNEHPLSPHKHSRIITLRGPSNGSAENWQLDIPNDEESYASEWIVFRQQIAQIFSPIAAYGKVMLVSLLPGGVVDWHTDEGEYAEAHRRFHVPITTNPGAVLLAECESAHLPVGQLTEINNRVLHSAINVGPTPRVHLIFDVRK